MVIKVIYLQVIKGAYFHVSPLEILAWDDKTMSVVGRIDEIQDLPCQADYNELS